MSKFVHFRARSSYSLGESICTINKLISAALKFKTPAIALSDKANMFGAMEFSLACQKSGIQPIHGCELTILYKDSNLNAREIFGELLIIAQNQKGFENLIKLASLYQMNMHSEKLIKYLRFDDLIKHKEGLFILCGSAESLPWRCQEKHEAVKILDVLQKNFQENLLIEVIRNSYQEQIEIENFFVNEAYEKKIPLIATNPIEFINKEQAEVKDVLHCIVNKDYIAETTRKVVDEENYFKSPEEMKKLFHNLPEAYENTVILAQKCHYFAEKRAPFLPKFCADNQDEKEVLKDVALEGLDSKLSFNNDEQKKKYIERLEYEVSVINRMNYAGYFLIVSDFIKWSKKNGIPVGPGRGSGAGSLVAYCLDITDIDPLEFGLLFERFLNPERISMPDFDIDFCQSRRDEVIDYVRKKYGEEKVAHIITFRALKARAALRDVGRVLGMPYGQVDSLCKMIPNNPANPVTLKQAIDLDKNLQRMGKEDPNVKRLLNIALQLEGIYTYISTHAAGIVIGDRNLTELVPLYKEHKTNILMIQYSFKYAEEAGLIKFDFLGLKTLTVISDALKLINQSKQKLTFQNKNFDDGATYANLTTGKTLGVFQFESAGMREAVKKIEPDNISDLIALGALYRPGPMDNIPRYVARKHKQEKPDYPHPLLKEILEETYGIIVYQEQVIKIAQKLAGYTLGGADLLRRAMGKKIKSEMEAQRNIFIKGAIDQGVKKSNAEDIFALIEKFASYGFPKPHAAAYAVISYQTAYLKANYPKEFFVALLNLDIIYTDKINLYVQDAKLMGIKVIPPSINNSDAEFTIKDDSIVFGLAAIKNTGLEIMRRIVEERNKNGNFQDFTSFLERNSDNLGKKVLDGLINSGSLNEIYDNQHELIDGCEKILRYCQNFEKSKSSRQMTLFDDEMSDNSLKLAAKPMWTNAQKMQAEFASFGFYLRLHPLDKHFVKLNKIDIVFSHQVEAKAKENGNSIKVAGTVTNKKIRSSQRGKYCFLQISDPYGLIELCIFNEQMLYKFNDKLEVGNSLLFLVDARKDDSGMRIIVGNIMELEEALAHIEVSYEIIVKSPALLPKVKEACSDEGNKFFLKLVTDNDNEVVLNTGSNLRIHPEKMERLRKIDGLVVNEH